MQYLSLLAMVESMVRYHHIFKSHHELSQELIFQNVIHCEVAKELVNQATLRDQTHIGFLHYQVFLA